MPTFQRATLCGLLVVIFAGLLSPAWADDTYAPAMVVIGRTKAVNSTYSSYIWNRIERPGPPVVEEWSAEFHSGKFHRVETPRDRLIANGVQISGTWYSVSDMKVFDGAEVASVACGINTNKPIRSTRLLTHTDSQFGPIDRIELTDADEIRTYDVTDDGVIVAETIVAEADHEHTIFEEHTVALKRNLPVENIFSRSSLMASVVPDRYKVAPAQ